MKLLFLAFAAILLSGCKATFGPGGDSVAERREAVLAERDEAVRMLIKSRPEVEETLKSAPGYAFFSSANLHILLLSSENAYGVVTFEDGSTQYLRSLGSGAGFGWGIKDFRTIVIFKTKHALDSFMNEGISPRLNADIAAIYEDEGGSISRALSVVDQETYQFTESGIALQATVQLSMLWADDVLNESPASR